jgi:hypothetical protein
MWCANGCSKEKSPVTQTVTQTVANQDTNQASDQAQADQGDHRPLYAPTTAPPPATAEAPTQTNSEPNLREIQRTLIRWTMVNHRAPKNFDDFAATAGIPIPPPPAGKKYFIDKTMHVLLVNQ